MLGSDGILAFLLLCIAFSIIHVITLFVRTFVHCLHFVPILIWRTSVLFLATIMHVSWRLKWRCTSAKLWAWSLVDLNYEVQRKLPQRQAKTLWSRNDVKFARSWKHHVHCGYGIFKPLPLRQEEAFVDWLLCSHVLALHAFAKSRSCRIVHYFPSRGKPCKYPPLQALPLYYLHL